MSQTVYLHVGLPKSGTTYLQRVLATNKAALADEDGLLFPGRTWDLQVLATRDVRQMSRQKDKSAGAWRRMVDEIHRWSGDAVVSMEWLCAADAEQVARIVDDLAPSHVVVVFTVRDLGRTLPSAWQEMVKNRKKYTWREFLDGVSADDPAATETGARFWPKQDMAAMLDTWGTKVAPEDLVVVTVPPSGGPPEELWRRFCAVLGIEPGEHGTSLPPRNESLGVESTEVMRRLNELTSNAGFSKEAHSRLFKHVVARRILSARRAKETRLSVPAEMHPWVEAAARRQVDEIARRGVRVVGDLEDLHAQLDGRGVDDPALTPVEGLVDAALDGIVGLVRDRRDLERRIADLRRENERLTGRLERQRETITRLRGRIKRFEDRPVRAAVLLRTEGTRKRLGRGQA